MKHLALILALTLPAMANATQPGNEVSNNCPGNSCHGGAGGNATSTGVGIGVGYANATGGNSNSSSAATVGNVSGGTANAVNYGNTTDVRNSSTNINGNSNTNKLENTSLNVQGQTSEQAQKQNQSTNNANNSTNSVTVEGDSFEARRIPVNTAFAPSIAPTANCSLSVSAGASFVGFSGSFGKAYIDQNCANNEDIRNVALVLGDKETAEQMKCNTSEAYRKARAALNRHCAVEQE